MWGTSWKARTNKVIDYLAEATFGVYLFHMYPANMTYLFEKLFSLQRVIEKPYAVLWVVAVTAVIFVVGVAIDSLRKAMFYSFEFLTNLIEQKITQHVALRRCGSDSLRMSLDCFRGRGIEMKKSIFL